MELWTSLQTAILAFIQLVTSAASCHNLRTENDSLVNYWPRHLILIINFTWNGLPICGFTSNLAISNFPIFSMVNKPTWIFFDYITSWTTNNPSNNLLYLVWFGNHRERASQILFVNNYAPIGPTRNEISWARFSWIFPIGDTLNNLYKFLQQLLCLWFLPAKWSVSQPLVSPVVGSSQPLCKKLCIFGIFPFLLVFHGFSPEFQSFLGLNIYHTCLWRFVLSSLSPHLPS